MSIASATIDKIKAEHPDLELHLISNEEHGVDVIVRPPSPAEWDRFRAMQVDPGQRPKAFKVLLLACLVHPTREDFASELAKRPGLAETFGIELTEIAGVNREVSRRKL